MRTAVEIKSIEILIKELEEIKVWTGIKLLIKIKYKSVVLLNLNDFRREI